MKKVAKIKQPKNYEVYGDGNSLTIAMKDTGTDGRYHSICYSLPVVDIVYNEETKQTDRKVVRRATLIKRALEKMATYYPSK